MRTLEELMDKIEPYRDVDYFYTPGLGYLVWRVGTGENVEMLFVEAEVIGKRLGQSLYQKLVEILQSREKSPYHSVFAFRLASNDVAKKFYNKMGWTQVHLGQSIYQGDETVLMWITWEDLVKNLGASSDENDT